MEVVSTTAVEGYGATFTDASEVLTRTFRVSDYPTLIVLREKQEVIRQSGNVDVEVLSATIAALRDGRVPHTWKVGIEIGVWVPGRFADFTGLIVCWQPDCDSCDLEADQVAALTALETVALEIIGADSDDANEATGQLRVLPGAPMHIYLRDGIRLWINTGVRDDLVELVQRVTALAR